MLSGVDTLFEETGKISKIPYLTYFRQYKKMLMKNRETPGVRHIITFWTKIVFAGVPLATAIDDAAVADDEAEAAAEAEFAAAFEDMNLGESGNISFDFGDVGKQLQNTLICCLTDSRTRSGPGWRCRT